MLCRFGTYLVAKDEDEYVQLVLQLASDVTVLSNLRAYTKIGGGDIAKAMCDLHGTWKC